MVDVPKVVIPDEQEKKIIEANRMDPDHYGVMYRDKDTMEMIEKAQKGLLDRFFIHQEKQAADRLAGDLHIDVKTVYRRKDDALCRFTVALYGKTEM